MTETTASASLTTRSPASACLATCCFARRVISSQYGQTEAARCRLLNCAGCWNDGGAPASIVVGLVMLSALWCSQHLFDARCCGQPRVELALTFRKFRDFPPAFLSGRGWGGGRGFQCRPGVPNGLLHVRLEIVERVEPLALLVLVRGMSLCSVHPFLLFPPVGTPTRLPVGRTWRTLA